MLVASRHFYCGEDLSCDADVCEASKHRRSIAPEISDGFVETDHSLLNDIVVFGSEKKIPSRLVLDKRSESA